MFHTPIEPRFGQASSGDRRFALGEQPLQFPARMDLCRHQAPAPMDCDALRFAAAARRSESPLAFRPAFATGDWRVLSSFCIARQLPAGHRVLIPGRSDRALRFVVEGTLCQESAIASGLPTLLYAGAMLGEEGLFSDTPCDLDVRTLEDSLVLELSLARQKELTASCPEIAFELLRAAGAMIAARNRIPARRAEQAMN